MKLIHARILTAMSFVALAACAAYESGAFKHKDLGFVSFNCNTTWQANKPQLDYQHIVYENGSSYTSCTANGVDQEYTGLHNYKNNNSRCVAGPWTFQLTTDGFYEGTNGKIKYRFVPEDCFIHEPK